MRINAAGPGCTATDFDGNNGTQTATPFILILE
jgi:hypothetical protein